VLLPHLRGVTVERVERKGRRVTIRGRGADPDATCPRCGVPSRRVHSRYERCLDDAALGGCSVLVRLAVRRFFCDNPDCPSRKFVEQVGGLTTPYARRTPVLRGMLEAIGLVLAGRAGARLAEALGLAASRSTMLRLLRALPEPLVGEVTLLGVDDFALRRRHVYATVLVDLASNRPVDVLPDRRAEALAVWLREHPGIRVICRDRAGAYAEAAADAAPTADQVADRWHLWHNLSEHVEKTVARHRKCRVAPRDPTHPDTAVSPVGASTEGKLVRRARERFAAVHALHQQGLTVTAITRELGLARGNVRRFIRAQTVDDVLAVARDGRPSILDPFKPYLHDRWQEGTPSAAQLFTEIRAMGYSGCDTTVRACLQPFRSAATGPPPVLGPPKVRNVTGWLLRTQTTAPSRTKSGSSRYSPTARIYRRPPDTSAPSVKCSTHAAANSSTGGSATCTPATFPSCVPSPPACSATAPQSATDSPSTTVPCRSRATSTESR
jgi:transposase